MGAVTILLIVLAALIMFIMYRAADDGDASADAVVVASGGPDAGPADRKGDGRPLVVCGPRPSNANGDGL
jgi:hypothetical protein